MPRDAQSIEALTSSLRGQISYVRDVPMNDVQYERERLRLQDLIDTFTAQLAKLNDLRTNGEKYIDGWRQQLADLKGQKLEINNSVNIEKLLKATREINDLTN